MQVSKVGNLTSFGKISFGNDLKEGVKEPNKSKISAGNIGIAAAAITAIGLATVSMVKKGKADAKKAQETAEAAKELFIKQKETHEAQKLVNEVLGEVERGKINKNIEEVAARTTEEAHKLRQADLEEAFKDFAEAA